MGKIGALGSHFQEVLQRAGTMPMDPPPDPKRGQLCREGNKWWRFTTPEETGLHPKASWLPIEPTEEQVREWQLQVTVQQAEDMANIADALKRGMLGEFQKQVNILESPPRENSPGGWYETGKGWSGGTTPTDHPCELQVHPSMKDGRYYIVAEALPKYSGEDPLWCNAYLPEEELEKRAENVKVYGEWMRTVGYELARYVWYARAEGKQREYARAAADGLAIRGIVVSPHDWMDNPELTDDVARAIASIKKD